LGLDYPISTLSTGATERTDGTFELYVELTSYANLKVRKVVGTATQQQLEAF